MKKIIIILFVLEIVFAGTIYAGFWDFLKQKTDLETFGTSFRILLPSGGGTGTGTAPTYGQMLVGNSGGTYTLTATSSLGITAAGDGVSNWVKQTNYGVLNLTASTTIPYWAKDAFYASSTSVFQGLATFGNASTTQISATNSYVGTVLTGIWNGTALGNAYVDDDITLTNITQITNRAITDLTGTLTVSNGGTGQTSLTSSQLLYGNGTAALSSVATTTLTGTAPMVFSNPISVVGGSASVLTCTAASGSVAGCLASADWTTFNGKQAGDATLTALAGLTISAGSLITGTGADAFSVLAGGTNGYVLAMSGSAPVWVATTTLSTISGTLDISAQSNLTAGTGITLTGDDLSIDTSQNIATLSNLTSNGFVKTSGGAGTLSVDTSTYLTTVDISANTNLAVSAPIVLTGDTLSLGNVVLYPAFTYATSSASFTGTTTLPLGVAQIAETFNSVSCYTDTGTVWLAFDDGTNVMEYLQASTTVGIFTLSSNNSFSALEKRYVKFGNAASSPTKISCTIKKTISAN